MKIVSLELTNFPPLKNLKIESLGSTVIIAGANGSGKSRLKEAIIQTLQGNPLMRLTLAATRNEERENYFSADSISVTQGVQNPTLTSYITSRRYGAGRFVGSLVQIDSNRNVANMSYSQVNWLGGDPDDSESQVNYYFNPFTNRWNDFMNYIHQKSAARDKKLADELKKNPKNGEQIVADFPDPLDKYKKIFANVLPGKTLQDVNPASPREFHYIQDGGSPLPFSSLSSGEQEVVKVLFDVARKDIRHSVILVDEPELHLHPTLAFKLVEELKRTGDHTNQFIFLTHSADLISTYYSSGDVFFIDSNQTNANQAHRLSDVLKNHEEVAQLMGQNLGLFAVGKDIVFVEGETSSIDRLTYHAIAQQFSPVLKVLPVGSVSNISALKAFENQIRSSIFGINIFMIRDRDGLNDEQVAELTKNGRIHCLERRHIENYFLDGDILFKAAKTLYLTTVNTSLTSDLIESELKRIAAQTLNFNLLQTSKEYLAFNFSLSIPNVKAVDGKSVDELQQNILDGIKLSLNELINGLDESKIKLWLKKEENRLSQLLKTDDWKKAFQGKLIFSKFCSEVLKEDPLRVRQAYVDIALKEKPEIFKDISDFMSRR